MKILPRIGFLVTTTGTFILPSIAFAVVPALLPFQGRLTDANGAPIADGAKTVQFKIYDAPTGGANVWSGEVHKLTVNGGLVSTLLGSKAPFTAATDFNNPLYLEITVDANNDNQITAADPPLLPRQSVLPAVFAVESASARDSTKLAGADWSSIMVDGTGVASNSPGTGFVKGSKIQSAGVTATQLATNSVTASKIASGAVANSELAANAVTSDKILDGSVGPADLSSDLQMGIVPAGTVVAFAGSAVPPGWLLCDGAALSRTTYATLFGAIGSGHGSGNGTSTFNLPDYRGYFLRGVDNRSDSTVLPAAVNATSNAITVTAHGFNRSTYPVQISNTGGALPAGLAANTTYYAIVVDSNSIKLASSEANALANSPVDITSAGSGTHKIVPWIDPDRSSRGAMAIGGAAGNAVGSVQGDEFKSHTHQADWIFHAHVTPPMDLQIDNAASRWRATKSNTSATGGNETRPKNAYVNYIIKY